MNETINQLFLTSKPALFGWSKQGKCNGRRMWHVRGRWKGLSGV